MNVLVVAANPDAPFLTQQVDALEERGVSVRTLSIAGEVSLDVDRSPLDYLRTIPRVLRETRSDYDLVHAHYGLTAPIALAQLRLPVVLSLWGSDVYGPAAPVSKLCAPLCAETIVMSAAMREALGRGTVIPDGVDLDRFRPEPRSRARAAVRWPDDEYHVLFPYSPARTVKNYSRAKRVVAAASRRLDRPVRLQTISGVDHDTVPTYLNAADALILTSDSEGSPNSVKEALACNVPVVSLPVGDVPERLAGVDPSAVARTDRELVDGLVDVLERGERSNGREAAREVSLERTTERLLAVYERAVGTGVARRGRSALTPE